MTLLLVRLGLILGLVTGHQTLPLLEEILCLGVLGFLVHLINDDPNLGVLITKSEGSRAR